MKQITTPAECERMTELQQDMSSIQTLWGGSPHDSSSSWGRKLPTPPWPLRSEMSKKIETQQMAFRDAMEVAQSPPMTWEDWVQEEEDKHERHSSTGGDSQLCPSSP